MRWLKLMLVAFAQLPAPVGAEALWHACHISDENGKRITINLVLVDEKYLLSYRQGHLVPVGSSNEIDSPSSRITIDKDAIYQKFEFLNGDFTETIMNRVSGKLEIRSKWRRSLIKSKIGRCLMIKPLPISVDSPLFIRPQSR